jgi:hypothetical protein
MKPRFESLIASKRLVQLETKHPDGTVFSGVLLAENENFIVFREFASFEPDGLIVVPRRWIRAVRDSEQENCTNAIIRHNGAIDRVKSEIAWLGDANTLREVLSHLLKEDIWPAIEIVLRGEGYVYLGKLIALSAGSFDMRCYSSDCEWLESQKFSLRFLFKIEIGSRYTKNFSSYMRTIPIPPEMN